MHSYSITIGLAIAMISYCVGFRSLLSSKLSKLSNLKINSVTYQLNPKDLLIADSCSGLSRSEISQFVLQLEKKNPTAEPAYSPLLNGVWEIVSAAIFSPGMVGLQAIKSLPGELISAEDLTVTISSMAPRVSASTAIKVGNAKLDVTIVTNIEVRSPVRIVESYESGKLGSFEVPLSDAMKTVTRELLISYLDEDLLIARDPFGTPEILRRKEYSNRSGDGSGDGTQADVPSA